MAGIYTDGEYLSSNPTWHEEDSPWKASQIARVMERNSLTVGSVCEVGCGAGEILNLLSARYATLDYYGYEISPQAHALCVPKTKPNLQFYLANLLDLEDEYFDIVMAIDVLEHVEDYFSFLRKLKLRGKYKIFHIPLDLSVQTVMRSTPIINARKSVGHLHYFTKETALESLKDTGYEVVDFFYTAGAVDLPKRGWKANLFNIPRKILFGIHRDFAVRLLGGYSLMVLAK